MLCLFVINYRSKHFCNNKYETIRTVLSDCFILELVLTHLKCKLLASRLMLPLKDCKTCFKGLHINAFIGGTTILKNTFIFTYDVDGLIIVYQIMRPFLFSLFFSFVPQKHISLCKVSVEIEQFTLFFSY